MERENFEAKVTEIAEIGHYVPTFRHTPYNFRGSLAKGDEHIVITTGNGEFASGPVGRFRIDGWYPEPEVGRVSNIKSVEITMSDKKSAKQMEAEIQRRFRGKYLEQLGKAVEQINRANKIDKKRAAAIKAMSQAAGGTIENLGPATKYILSGTDFGIWKVAVNSGADVEFDLSPMPLEKALRLVEFMKSL